MIPRIKELRALDDYLLAVEFDDGRKGCVFWNDEIDLASDSIYEYGKVS